MAGFRVDTDAADIARALARVPSELADLEPVNDAAGRIVLASARPPHRSGALAAGLHSEPTRAEVAIASTVPYWTFVHFGAPRRHVRAQPFILSAITATKAEVAALYTDHARDVLSRVNT